MGTAGPAAVNGLQSTAQSTVRARQLYQQATRAFLVRDYSTAASCLHDGLADVARVQRDAWYTALVRDPYAVPGDVEVRRRLEILKVTLLATIRACPAARSPAASLTPLLELEPDKLVAALWQDLIGSTSAELQKGDSAPIVPTPAAGYLHPSLAVSLALAALKLESPNAARAVAEAWLGSVAEEVEVLAADYAAGGGIDWHAGSDFPLDQVAGNQSARTNGLSASSTLGGGGAGHAKEDAVALRALVGSWLKLLDLLVFHILPSLGEWDAAGDLVRLQGQENGGWVPDVRVEASLYHLKELQQQGVQRAAAQAQRQKELEIARAEKKKQSSAPGSRRSSDKGKQRARTDERGGSPTKGNSPPRAGTSRSSKSATTAAAEAPTRPPRGQGSPPLSSFTGLRDSLSTYLDRSAARSGPPPPGQPGSRQVRAAGPWATFVSTIRYHYATDPIRLVSFVCFTLALLTWTRRRLLARRARGQRGLGLGDALGLVVSRVAETVGMATKVTAM